METESTAGPSARHTMEAVLESERERTITEEEEEDGGVQRQDEEPVSQDDTHRDQTSTSLVQDLQLYPGSYRTCSPGETRLRNMAENFQRQFSHLHPERRPLLLCPVNECGVQKFVSTTLRPTPINHPELFTWEGCARFVADFLSLVPLDPPEDLPLSLSSPSCVLQAQRGSCFEFGTLLVSLLIGAHYDAYCVSGFAVRELCLLDQSLEECPLLDTRDKSVTPEEELQEDKYTLKPQRALESQFLMQQEKKKQESEAALLQKQEVQEQSVRPPEDRLRGLRRHCWVLVLSGGRGVTENFFIDPLTGNRYPTDHAHFLGVDSLWNNRNYYVNMQDCRDGCRGMTFDMEDVDLWEPILSGTRMKKQLIQGKESKMMKSMNEEEKEDQERPQVFEMPRSWVRSISISREDLEKQFPQKKKVTLYRRAKLERFAEFLRTDGLLTRLTTFRDQDCEGSEVISVKEWFKHRTDHLEQREVNRVDGVTTERFRRGRRFHLLSHRFTDTDHEMDFDGVSRVDDLVCRVETPRGMTEFFEGRRDLMFYRRAVFNGQVQVSEEDLDPDQNTWLQEVVERFHRNTSKPAHEDVAERVFLLAQRRIEVTYHVGEDRVIASKRSFIKPRESTEKEKAEDFRADMVSSFQVDPAERPLSTLALHELLMDLMRDEEDTVLQIIRSLKEMRDVVACRRQEQEGAELYFSPWTTTGAAQARRHREDMERRAADEQQWLQQKKKDILAPFLIRLNNPDSLSFREAQQLHQDCLKEFQQRLVEHANLIQERYHKETQELQRRQQWYQKNQLTMTDQQEEEYWTFCSEKTLRIQVTRRRLRRHQEEAPQKYSAFDQMVREDPRLAPHLKS